MLQSKNKGFLLVSAFIVLSDLLFILLNYRAALETLDQDTRDWARQAQKVFAIALDAKATAMQQLATYVANDPRIGNLFLKGQRAVAREGGGGGRERAAQARAALFEMVIPSWQTMSARYDVRQLHFHLGPGSTSFLRVHRPEKFGDNMDTVRYTVVDVNLKREPTGGFETGRVYSGIRGVVPVFVKENPLAEEHHVGALEAGTSFTVLLQSLKTELNSDFCVLLTGEHVHRNMWPDFIAQHFTDDIRLDDLYIEAVTGPDFKRVLTLEALRSLLGTPGSAFVREPSPLQVGTFPLRDYRGTRQASLPASGRVVVWRDAGQKWLVFKKTLWGNIVFAVIALLIVESVLLVVWNYSRRKLKAVIDDQTREINQNLERLESLMNAFPTGILMVETATGDIVDANPAAVTMLGAEKNSLVGCAVSDFVKPPPSAGAVEKTPLPEKELAEYQLERLNKEAIPVWCVRISTLINGQALTVVSLTDISEQKEAEYQKTQKEKLQGVLEMAGAICHEINQPMQSISGYTELLAMQVPEGKKEYVTLGKIKTQIDRMGEITRKLMAITRYETKTYLKGQIIDIDKASQAGGAAPDNPRRDSSI